MGFLYLGKHRERFGVRNFLVEESPIALISIEDDLGCGALDMKKFSGFGKCEP
jgi:hypothetical protein